MPDVQERYSRALEALVAKAEADPTVLAAVLLGSMAHDTVWERSDIDLLLVTQETLRKKEGLCLVESGVDIHCVLATRSEFRKMLEGSVQGSFIHSMLTKGRMLFSRDEPLVELFDSRHTLAERDRAIQMLGTASSLIALLAKAQKWYQVKGDYTYCCYWVLKCVDPLASIEVLLHGEVPTREVVHQALRLNPPLFGVAYTELIEGVPDRDRLAGALATIHAYLRLNADVLFAPILAYLAEEGALRSMTDIDHHFARHFRIESVATACEWLAQEGLLHKLATPVRLTHRAHVDFEEAAYYYPGAQQP